MGTLNRRGRGSEWATAKTFSSIEGGGCDACNQTGLKGRVALHELLRGSDELRNLIQNRAKTTEMQSLAAKEGMVTLAQDGILKILSGLTTYEQVRSVAMK